MLPLRFSSAKRRMVMTGVRNSSTTRRNPSSIGRMMTSFKLIGGAPMPPIICMRKISFV